MKTPKLYQRKRDGIWEVSYYHNNKRIRKSLGTRDGIEAGIQFTRFTGLPNPMTANVVPAPVVPMALVAPVAPEPPPIGTLYVDAVNEFIEAKWGIKNAWTRKRRRRGLCSTRTSQAKGILKKLQAFGNITYVEDVTFRVLQGYVARMTNRGGIDGKGYAPVSIVNHIGIIRRFLTFCVNLEYIHRNEANKLDKIKRKTPIRYSFSKDEIPMILENCKDRYRPFFELMLETGLRACDMWNLTRDNFPGEDVHIVQEKTGDELYVPISKRAQKIAKGLPHRLFPWADRSWTRERDEMDGRVEVQNELRICFAGDRIDGCLKRGKEICRPKGIRLHTFRHTFAMWKLAAGCPLEVIKDLMGHKSVAMAELYASQLPKTALAKWV